MIEQLVDPLSSASVRPTAGLRRWQFGASARKAVDGRTILPIAVAAAIGGLAWSGSVTALPLSLLWPAAWGSTRSRRAAFLAGLAYFGAAARDLPVAAGTFFHSPSLAAGLAIWAAGAGFNAGIWALTWSRRARPRAVGCVAALATSAVPPLCIGGWASPLHAAGALFPATGWIGLAAATGIVALLAAMPGRRAILCTAAITGCVAAILARPAPVAPPGWLAVNTHSTEAPGPIAGYASLQALIAKASRMPADTVAVWPESAVPLWTAATDGLWARTSAALARRRSTALIGTTIAERDGLVDVMMPIGADAGEPFRDRIPVPVGMWAPWRGSRSYALDFFGRAVHRVAGLRAGIVICYEQLLVWPVATAVAHGARILIAPRNLWFARGTTFAGDQRAIMSAWGRLFSIPVVAPIND